MSYNPIFEASKVLPKEHLVKKLEEFVAGGQDLTKRRFSRSPPTVPSVPSTTWEESEPSSPTEHLQNKESKELQKSTAAAQWGIQMRDEVDRILAARDRNLLHEHIGSDWEDAAEANVKYRWIQQGIWDERWESEPSKTWKHERDDTLLPRTCSESTSDGLITGFGTKRERQGLEPEEDYAESLRCAIDFQNRQSSRPCYQFLYQFCQERQWIKMGLSNGNQSQHANLDTTAYENLKSRWIRDGIWDDEWTSIPGTTWRHERLRKFPSSLEVFRQQDARKAAKTEKADRPPRWYFMAPSEPPKRVGPDVRAFFPLESVPGSMCSDSTLPKTLMRPFSRNPPMTSQTSHEAWPLASVSQPSSNTRHKTNPEEQEEVDDHHTTSVAMKPTKPSPNRKSTKSKGKRPQIQRNTMKQIPMVGPPQPTKPRPAKIPKTNRHPRSRPKNEEPPIEATGSRPRRKAALKAMQNLSKARAR